MPTDAEVRAHLEQYYDTVPRSVARAEDFGSLTLFVREGPGFALYGRPTLGHPGPVTAADLQRVLARQRELEVPRSIEWVDETTPSLAGVAAAAGLHVHRHPLMLLQNEADAAAPSDAPAARILAPDDPVLPAVGSAQHLGFGTPGTARGEVGRAELAEAAARPDALAAAERLATTIRSGRSPHAAVVEDGAVLSAGAHIPLGTTTEIVGVATLPSERRRGLGAAVTAALVADARGRGIETIFLSAGDDDVARVYGRLGFVGVGTALIADGE